MPSEVRFLVVGDISTMRRIVINLLKESGFSSIEEAEEASAALHKLRNARFDFVVCDINMANVGGLHLLADVKNDNELRHIPVLMLTAAARKEDILQAARLGAAGYVVKPFTKATLEHKVLHILRKAGLQ